MSDEAMKVSPKLRDEIIKQNVMAPNPRWNRMGPRVPEWFLFTIRRFDPRLTLQFMPPWSERETEGVHPGLYPHGVWVICRTLPRSRLLLKRWTWHLTDKEGNFCPPGPNTVNVLREAHAYYRSGVTEEMEGHLDNWITQAQAKSKSDSRTKLVNNIYDMITKNDMFSKFHGNRVFFGGGKKKAG